MLTATSLVWHCCKSATRELISLLVFPSNLSAASTVPRSADWIEGVIINYDMCGIPGEHFAPDWTPGAKLWLQPPLWPTMRGPRCGCSILLVGKTTILLSIRCKLISSDAILSAQLTKPQHTIHLPWLVNQLVWFFLSVWVIGPRFVSPPSPL